jgi:hypothetical protein
MEYTRTATELYLSPLSTPIKRNYITVVYGSDGWTYVPELGIRRKFTTTHYTSESWEGNLPIPEHIEKVEWSLYSEAPLIWREQSDQFDEIYELKLPIQKEKKNIRALRVSRQ